jgi:hypothetical protein
MFRNAFFDADPFQRFLKSNRSDHTRTVSHGPIETPCPLREVLYSTVLVL